MLSARRSSAERLCTSDIPRAPANTPVPPTTGIFCLSSLTVPAVRMVPPGRVTVTVIFVLTAEMRVITATSEPTSASFGRPNCGTAFRRLDVSEILSPLLRPFGARSTTSFALTVLETSWIVRIFDSVRCAAYAGSASRSTPPRISAAYLIAEGIYASPLHTRHSLLVEVRPPKPPRLSGGEPGCAEHLDDFVCEVPLIVGKARWCVPGQSGTDVLVCSEELRAVELVRAPMQVTYLLDQRLKWLIFHHVSREATAGGLSIGRNLGRAGPARQSEHPYTSPHPLAERRTSGRRRRRRSRRLVDRSLSDQSRKLAVVRWGPGSAAVAATLVLRDAGAAVGASSISLRRSVTRHRSSGSRCGYQIGQRGAASLPGRASGLCRRS